MKYYNTSRFTKAVTSTGFITVVACALIAIGAIGWFALSRSKTVTETPSDNSSLTPSYPDANSSYNSKADTPDFDNEPAADVNDEVSNVPYTETETTSDAQPEVPSFILPITGNISKGYSDSALQYSATYGDMRLHTGVDILCEIGSNIKSAGSGTVKSVTEDANYGKVITIEHSGGITVKYCGMGSINIKENDKVAAGDIIGTSGEIPCECADKPHIHIEVYSNGNAASPLEALGLE